MAKRKKENPLEMNLFGDWIEDVQEPIGKIIDHTIPEEVGNDESVSGTGAGALGEVAAGVLPEASAGGNTGIDAGEGRGGRGGEDSGLDDNGNEAGRSRGDSAPGVYTPQAGKGPDGTAVELKLFDKGVKSAAPAPRPAGTLRNGHTDDRGNYHITADDPIGKGGKASKADLNIEAIRILKDIEAQARHATPEEQSKLVLYSGWGGLSEIFKDDLDGPWKKRQTDLKSLLTDAEYRAARHSTMNAHYTSVEVTQSVWNAVTRLGYTGGPTLEPACGIGHFFGTRPGNLPVEMHGIELDQVSGRIARQLYQTANIKVAGYETIKMPENEYNLIISNVPFGSYKAFEEKSVRTPGLDNSHSIHDFYFLKSLHGLRPGGVVAFITSRYTMDKVDTDVRSMIASKADFLGAIRLPNTAFREIADTEVVTDVLLLQKRLPGVEMSALTRSFIETGSVSLEKADGGIENVFINKYYIEHPEMVLGKQNMTGKMYGAVDEYTVFLPVEDLAGKLTGAINRLPENVMNVIVEEKIKELDTAHSVPIPSDQLEKLMPGAFVVGTDNQLYQKNINSGQVALAPHYKDKKESKNIPAIIQLVNIRDTLKSAIDNYHEGRPVEMNRDLSRLNSLYDNFVKEHGYINERANRKVFLHDPESSLVRALEIWDQSKGTAIKSDIFKGLNFTQKETVTHVSNPLDAMVLSLSRYGTLNIPYMEAVTGTPRDELVKNLMSAGHIYQDPYEFTKQNKVTYLTADAYISGNVREKLKDAREAMQKDPDTFFRNVRALEDAIPKDLPASEISVRINSPIIGENHVKDFVKEVFDARYITVDHMPILGKWDIKVGQIDGSINYSEYGIRKMPAVEILNNMMNGRPIKIYDRFDRDQPPVLNQELTDAAVMKADEINKAFQKWVWSDQNRTKDIERRYNDVYNSYVERQYIHPERMINPDAKIKIHGCNFAMPLRPNQADAVWRIVQSQNTMLAHSVGAGKTLSMACAAMEMRRLGIRNKPMIVCPDHMIEQWGKEFRQAYPSAKLLVADDLNWHKDNRRDFVNRIALGDWDAVIIRAESFKMISMSKEEQYEYFNDKLRAYEDYLRSLEDSRSNQMSIKECEKAIEKFEVKLQELNEMKKDEGILDFDKLGVDHIMVDEADLYKNLYYTSQLQNIRGMGNKEGSERAIDLHMKIQYIQKTDGGITFATGTPISNTLVEAYTMMRYLQPEVLKAHGLESFDEWARQFAESVTQMELNNTGTGYVPVTRFSKICNVPELVTILRQSWDIQTAQNLEDHGILVPGENLPYMKVINVSAPSTPLLKSFLKHLEWREEHLKGKPEKGGDNILKVMTDGRKASIDMRLINAALPDDPDSKLNLAVKTLHELYVKYEPERYTTAVFFDKARSYAPDGKVIFDAIDDMKSKLIEKGVKKEEIGDVRQCKNYEDRQMLFTKVNNGEVRIIFGSTESMGAGTNFQTYLKAIAHVDAPWRPRDIEQQNGRGYRPGNKTGELEVYNFVTKGSLDTGLWNVLETKAKSIRQIMEGADKVTREIEDDYFGSVKELSIDNPLMKESVELDQALRKLRNQEKAYIRETSEAIGKMKSIPEHIEMLREDAKKIEEDILKRPPELKGDDFKMEIDGKIYTKREEAGDKIKGIANKLYLQGKREISDLEIGIGQYAGLDLVVRVTTMDTDKQIGKLQAVTPNGVRYTTDIHETSTSVGLCTSLHMKVYKGMETSLECIKKEIELQERELVKYEQIKNLSFPKKDELAKKELRYKEVMLLLENERANQKEETRGSYNMPWNNLPDMDADQIKHSLDKFYAGLDEARLFKKIDRMDDGMAFVR